MSIKQSKLRYYIPEINAVLYGLLIILIPFVMLQNYLQSTIYLLNQVKFQIFNIEIPFLVIVFLLLLITISYSFRKHLSFFRAISFIIIILLLLLAEINTDHYAGANFTDLQNNWHYFAYGTYAGILFRLLSLRGKPLHKSLFFTFLICIALSAFDEGYQFFLSSRVFDISDIAKDSWGCNLGLLAVLFVFREGNDFKHGYKIFHQSMKGYWFEPASVLFLQLLFSFLFVYFGSLLTEHKYMFYGVLTPLLLFILIFFVIYLTKYKIFKKILIVFVSIAVIVQAIFFIINFKRDFTYCDNNIIIYKGLIIPFLDVKVSSRGNISLIDKKEDFIMQDIRFLIDQNHDIIIIGKGNDGSGGKGFYKQNDEEVHFLFNTNNNKGIQLIILDSKSACSEFNRLKKQGFDVLMIIHNA